ncbi:peptide deformylase [Candidatus Parcubacteria bacterium]|nr:peptide deformylase [Candidatus Parcubacteria bacterium]
MKDPIIQEGAQVLRLKAKPVLKKDIESLKVRSLIAKMKKVLAKEEFGVAIAAPQVGESLRIFVVAGRAFREDSEVTMPDKVFINPELIRLSRKKKEMTEGCLSVRNKYGSVLRHEKASVKALDEQGRAFTYHGSELLGHIFQHEYDHLEGILYIDKAVRLQDDENWQKLGETED